MDAALQNDGSVSAAIWNLPPEQLSIDEEVTELEGTPAICLIGQITGKEISQALGFLFSSLENSAGLSGENQPEIDWEKITAQVSAYVNKETYLPLRAQISVQGLDEVLAGLMGNGASLSIQNADITVEYASYEPVEPCVLPEGAKEAAEQAQRLLEGNPDNGDGTFTIQESGYYTDITAPEGYVLDYVNYDEVDFYNEELDRKVCYQMWTTADSNDFLFWDLVNEEETLYCGDADGTAGSSLGWSTTRRTSALPWMALPTRGTIPAKTTMPGPTWTMAFTAGFWSPSTTAATPGIPPSPRRRSRNCWTRSTGISPRQPGRRWPICWISWRCKHTKPCPAQLRPFGSRASRLYPVLLGCFQNPGPRKEGACLCL